MKKLNQLGTSTMNTLISMLKVGTNNKTINYSHGNLMTVSVELLYEYEKYRIFSITKYNEYQGKQICDSEMRFILNKNSGDFFPCYYKDNMGLEQESIRLDCGFLKSVRIIQQLEHSVVGNQFLESIKFQLNL